MSISAKLNKKGVIDVIIWNYTWLISVFTKVDPIDKEVLMLNYTLIVTAPAATLLYGYCTDLVQALG